jgi:hyperosmotically inducible periplasmic protein
MKTLTPKAALLAAMMAAVSLTTLTACESTRSTAKAQPRESVGEYVDDATITTKVKAALAKDPDVKAYQVNVETYKGVVQLSGFVDSEANVRRAAQVAQGVSGVRSVKNDVRVKPAG